MKSSLITLLTSIIIAVLLNVFTPLPDFWLGVVIVVPVFICLLICDEQRRNERVNFLKLTVSRLSDEIGSMNEKLLHIESVMIEKSVFIKTKEQVIDSIIQLQHSLCVMQSDIADIKNRQFTAEDLMDSAKKIGDVLNATELTIDSIKSDMENSIKIIKSIKDCISQAQNVYNAISVNTAETKSVAHDISSGISKLISCNQYNNDLYDQYVKKITDITQNHSLELRKQFKNVLDDISSKLSSTLRGFKESIEEFSEGTDDITTALKEVVDDMQNEILSFGRIVNDLNGSIDRFSNSFDNLKIQERQLTDDEKRLIEEIKKLKSNS